MQGGENCSKPFPTRPEIGHGPLPLQKDTCTLVCQLIDLTNTYSGHLLSCINGTNEKDGERARGEILTHPHPHMHLYCFLLSLELHSFTFQPLVRLEFTCNLLLSWCIFPLCFSLFLCLTDFSLPRSFFRPSPSSISIIFLRSAVLPSTHQGESLALSLFAKNTDPERHRDKRAQGGEMIFIITLVRREKIIAATRADQV